MNLHPGQWVKVKIKDFAYRGIIAEVHEPRIDIMIQSPIDNYLRRFQVPIGDIIGDYAWNVTK